MVHLCYKEFEKDQRIESVFSFFFCPNLKTEPNAARVVTVYSVKYTICFLLLRLLQVSEERDHCTKIK